MKIPSLISSTLLLVASSAIAAPPEGNPSLGKIKAPSCPFCHGADGISVKPSYPNLNNQSKLYLFRSMKAYQNNERTGSLAEMMKGQLSQLNDQDIADIAAYYAKTN